MVRPILAFFILHFSFFICSCNPIIDRIYNKDKDITTTGEDYEEFPPGTLIHQLFDVADESEWAAAVGGIINSGNDKNYVINVSGDFSVAGHTSPTFGGVSGVTVSLRGADNGTLNLNGSGHLLRVESNQTIILRDINLRGNESNPFVVVRVENNGAFTMYSGGISDNGETTVYNRGTLAMYGGEISGLNSGISNHGSFTMYGGKISGISAHGVDNDTYGIFTMYGGEISGGGFGSVVGPASVYTAGIFYIVTGIIYGSGEGGTAENTAALRRSNGTVQYGTFSGGTWSGNGLITATITYGTIRVVSGDMLPILISVRANGFPTLTSTAVILTFSPLNAGDGMNTDDITLTGIDGIQKGQLSTGGPRYTLPINGFTGGGTLTVSVSKVGYPISGSPKTVTIYHSSETYPLEMQWIPAGTFMMGSPEDEPDRQSVPLEASETQHQVTLTQGFYMGKYPVTQMQYEAVVGNNPSTFGPSGSSAELVERKNTADFPVETISWYDAIVFCNTLSIKENLSPAYRINESTDPANWGPVPRGGPFTHDPTWDAVQIVADSSGYRLPTEAQWEYACRAGTITAYNTGDTINADTGWYVDNSGAITHEVGTKPANAWGLYDMAGNVSEWCGDFIGEYETGAQTDPAGPVSGADRVRRGGSYQDSSKGLRSAAREYDAPGDRGTTTGFRVIKP